jgi:putative Mn2+ efflux pump MntP
VCLQLHHLGAEVEAYTRWSVAVLHEFLGLASIAGALTVVGAAAWSVIAARRSAGRRDHRFAVDRAVLAALLLIAAAGLVGSAMFVSGSQPRETVHLLYGPAAFLCLPIAIAVGARASAGRASRMRRDTWTAVGGLVLVGLGLRLLATG